MDEFQAPCEEDLSRKSVRDLSDPRLPPILSMLRVGRNLGGMGFSGIRFNDRGDLLDEEIDVEVTIGGKGTVIASSEGGETKGKC